MQRGVPNRSLADATNSVSNSSIPQNPEMSRGKMDFSMKSSEMRRQGKEHRRKKGFEHINYMKEKAVD